MSNEQAQTIEVEQSPAGTRPPGRPRGRFDPRLDWDIIEREYVTGIAGEPGDRNHPAARHWPTFRELGARHGVSHARVHQKSKRYGWRKRREISKENYKLALDAALVKAAALSTAEQVQYLDDYIRKFGKNIRDDRVRADAINDFDKAARLREFLLGNADSRAHTSHSLTLDAMQTRFANNCEERRTVDDLAASNALAGVLTNEQPLDALDAHTQGEGIAGNTENQQSSIEVLSDSTDLEEPIPSEPETVLPVSPEPELAETKVDPFAPPLQ